MNKHNLKKVTTLLTLLIFCGTAKAETIKVLTQNIWGVPDSVSVRSSAPKMQERRVLFCNKLKSLRNQSPDIVMVQEVWDAQDAMYMAQNCGYSYYSYQDHEGSKNIVRSDFQKLTSNFFKMVKEQIDKALSYFGVKLDDIIQVAVCLSYTSDMCNMLEDVGAIPNRGQLLNATKWFKDSYVKSGLLILSKYPIALQARMVYSDRGDLNKILSDLEASVTKSLLLVKVSVNGSPLWVANTHLISDHEYKPYENDYYSKQRINQFSEALGFIKKTVGNDPVIFGGDFNMGATYPCWEAVKYVLGSSADVQMDLDDRPTYDGGSNKYANANEGKLDHILGMNGVKATYEDLAFVNAPVSDHYGIYKIFSVPTI